MNEEEEFVEGAFEMEDWRSVVDISRFDEDEHELYSFLAANRDMSEFTAGSLGLLEDRETTELLEGELVATEKGTQWEGGLMGALRVVKSLEWVYSQNPSDELEAKIVAARQRVERFQRMITARDRLLLDNDTTSFIRSQNPGHWNMRGTEHPPLMEPVRTTPEMTVSPANQVKLSNQLVQVDHIDSRQTVMHRVKRSTRAVVGFDLGLGTPVTKAIPALPTAPLSASNANPVLKENLRRIIREELETGTLEQEVADTFAEALDAALRGLR